MSTFSGVSAILPKEIPKLSNQDVTSLLNLHEIGQFCGHFGISKESPFELPVLGPFGDGSTAGAPVECLSPDSYLVEFSLKQLW
jgi:hypothetical protein